MSDIKGKSSSNKYSKEIAIPKDVAARYMEYCEITKMNMSEPLRVMVLESIPNLHNAKNLDEIIVKTRERKPQDADLYEKFYVRIPHEAIEQINTFCKFFKLKWKRCHFLYFLIEERLLRAIEDVKKDE